MLGAALPSFPRAYARAGRASVALALVALAGGLGCDRKEAPISEPAVSASAAPSAASPMSGPKVYERVILSTVYEVDRIYKSMEGPNSTEHVHLASDARPEDPELLWIVGFEAVMVQPDGEGQISQEFMCHTNLDIDPTRHNHLFADDKPITGRLFTLSQGQYRIDMPQGFGIPILSSELLSLNTQVLNLNDETGRHRVRHKVITRYLRDAELKQPLKALFPAGAYGLKLLEGNDGHYGRDKPVANPVEPAAEVDPHTECLPGKNASLHAFEDGKGRSFTGHWVVEPGREVNHTRVTELMALPFDTTLHYVAVHLHPFAESLELRDLTADKSLYTARTRQTEGGIGLAHVDFFSSEAGIPLFKDHEYEIISVYENTSKKPQDSMAVMNLYLHDKAFKKPDLAAVKKKLAAEAKKPAGDPHADHHHHDHKGM
jgi:hypothetical protein